MCKSLDLVSSTAKRNQNILVLKGEVRAGAGSPTNPLFFWQGMMDYTQIICCFFGRIQNAGFTVVLNVYYYTLKIG